MAKYPKQEDYRACTAGYTDLRFGAPLLSHELVHIFLRFLFGPKRNVHQEPQCPHCVDEFRFDYQKIAKLTYGWRVRVRCPGCGNIVEVVMLAYTVIRGSDPDKYQAGEIVGILPPDPNPSPGWRMAVNKLRMEILQKKTGWLDGDLSHAENQGWTNLRWTGNRPCD